MDQAASYYSTSATPLLLLGSLLTLAVSLLVLIGRRTNGRGKAQLPPGPPALLFLAKFLALRRSVFDLGPLLVDLHARHGPVVSVRLFRTFVFVADRKVAHRALVQGGATFSDRLPPIEPSRMLSSGGRMIGFSPYGPYWRLLRRNLATEALSPARVADFAAARRWACDGLVSSLLAEQGRQGQEALTPTVRPLLRRAMFELLVFMCFGARLGREAMDEVEELQHLGLLSITAFPVFAFFPAVTKRLFRRSWAAYLEVRRRQDEVFVPLIHAERGDSDPPCYAQSLLAVRLDDDEGGRRLTDAEMVSLCSEFLSGGTDTTVTLVEWIMAELVNRPDVQAKVYEEVKANPELNDLQAMPYLKAAVLEGLRLHPPGHLLLPHGLRSGDAEIGGYTVPKGAEVNFLVAEMGRDETVWTAAGEYRPERFLEGAEGHDVDITGSREIKMMPFGAGRRMCPGYLLGMHHAEYFVGRMVRDIEWRPPVDGEEVDMTEVLDFTHVMKYPLRGRVIPRT
uniref:Uncharacterized protein n=1 Tax=Avena sativa TaxID=4498 RepID=A0ACD5ZTG0_AVESA